MKDPARAAVLVRFFKTGPGQYGAGDRFLGITVPALRILAAEFELADLKTVASLLRSPWHEARALAILILVRQYQRADEGGRAAIHRLYLANTRFINNWDLVDVSAALIVGAHLDDPRQGSGKGRSRALLRKLGRSADLWERRIAIVATHHFIRRGRFDETLGIAKLLLGDREDLIHKATGWMLREVGKRDRAVLESFLEIHAPRMPRTALRYAIERFPEPLRRKYLRTKRNG
jgi:3-methyladenine DNA glycosylase AlkD